MIDLAQTKKLARVRDVELRIAGIAVAATASQMAETEVRIARIEQLSYAVGVGAGPCVGHVLASGGESVSRLLAGHIATSSHANHQAGKLEIARQSFDRADARAQIAQQHLLTARRAHAKQAELRAALEMPDLRAPKCS